MSDETAIDPSGWESWTDNDGTMHVRITVTKRARQAMSLRQIEDLEQGGERVARAFEPDDLLPPEQVEAFDDLG